MTDFASLVEPRLGTDVGRWIAFSSACRPFGMVSLAPDSVTDKDWGGGYRYSAGVVQGFSHIHSWQISGILVMPVTGDISPLAGPAAWESTFSHDSERCKPGFHALTLDRYGIAVELTATLRVGVHRYRFPTGAQQPAILLDLASTLGPCEMGGAALKQTGPRTLQGHVINQPTVRKPRPLTIYFAIEVDQDVTIDPFDAADVRTCLRPSDVDQPVTMKVAISYTSVDAAIENLHAETTGKSFDVIRDEAQAEWNAWLSRITVEGGTDEQRARFYTDLYFSLCGRRTMSDAAGTYIDNTGPQPRVRQIPIDPATGQPRYRHHNSDAFWGTQWSLVPLWSIAYPHLVHDFCHCFYDMYANGGLIPRGPAAGNYTFVMTSAQSTPLYAAALHSGIYKPADADALYAALRKNHFPGGLMSKAGYEHHTCIGGGIEDYIALGYIPEDLPKSGFHNNGASQTIEHAFNDNAMAAIARTLGKADDVALFIQRSRNWRNLFDKSVGFVRPRNRDGTWLEPYDPMSRRGWTECNAWTMTFYATYDLDGLIECFDSRDALLSQLERGFQLCRDRGYYVPHEKHEDVPFDFGNEPALACCHLFQRAGDHRRTQFWLRQVLDTIKSGNDPTDNFAGDEDEGIMGAWNVLAGIGLFCIDGAASNPIRYMITAPLFDKITIALDDRFFPGRSLTIATRGNAPGAVKYIGAAAWNGQPIDDLSLTHDQIVSGGELVLDLID
ncbi:MAG TPA: GH92 family glycosyl hydrolase [Tepidisphaeraceae bacterium]|jgi:predicted alpha-1,2-mannosidase|nr:GH92 family glycosyl hydrolase [Tepidisphaeraceae bacterium]